MERGEAREHLGFERHVARVAVEGRERFQGGDVPRLEEEDPLQVRGGFGVLLELGEQDPTQQGGLDVVGLVGEQGLACVDRPRVVAHCREDLGEPEPRLTEARVEGERLQEG
ncbi:hypothetical protein D3C86_1339750 [compost metagenome]